jgi:hypothetical protein
LSWLIPAVNREAAMQRGRRRAYVCPTHASANLPATAQPVGALSVLACSRILQKYDVLRRRCRSPNAVAPERIQADITAI